MSLDLGYVLNTYFIEHLFWTVLFRKTGINTNKVQKKNATGIQKKKMLHPDKGI